MFRRNQTPPPQPVVAEAPVAPAPRLRNTRAAGRVVRSVSWNARRGLVPVLGCSAVYGVGSVARHMGVTYGAVIAVFALVGLVWWLITRKWLDRQIERSYAQLIVLATAVWLVGATAWGTDAKIFGLSWTFWLIAGGIPMASPWWSHFHYRMTPRPAEPSHVLDRVWQDRMLNSFPNTRIVDERTLPDMGYTGTILGVPGRDATEDFVRATLKITSGFEGTLGSVVIDTPTSGGVNRARISYYGVNHPLREPILWPGIGEFDPLTGVAIIGKYDDKSPVKYRLYKTSGPVHDLVSGTTDSGKSRFLDQCLAIERLARRVRLTDEVDPFTDEVYPAGSEAPLFVSYVIDPQGGQSLPEWQDDVAGYARSVEDGLVLLQALHAELAERNDYLSQVRWTDDVRTEKNPNGRRRKGVSEFNPLAGPTRNMKFISITIDEAHKILATPLGRYLCEDMAKMVRKCGGRLRLVTQVPLLDQLGNSATLRDMLVGGNVVVFRTGSAISSQVVLGGVLPVDPYKLPREWPDGSQTGGLGFVLGPQARPAQMRTYFVQDPFGIATEQGETVRLAEPMSQELKTATSNYIKLGRFGADEPTLAERVAASENRAASGAGSAVAKESREKPGAVRAAILELMSDGKGRERGEIISLTGGNVRTVGNVLRHLVETEMKLTKPREGFYIDPVAAAELQADPVGV